VVQVHVTPPAHSGVPLETAVSRPYGLYGDTHLGFGAYGDDGQSQAAWSMCAER
jgi:hypothetical protein